MERKNRKNLLGWRFGQLKIVKYVGVRQDGSGTPRAHWQYRCDCNRIGITSASNLLRGNKTACGNCGHNRDDLTGKRFGRWRVIGFAETRGGRAYWNCRCSCTKKTRRPVYSGSLRRGLSTSCGCLKREISAKTMRRVATGNTWRRTHGESFSAEHRVWSHMKGRCYCETDAAYENYGGRGIKVCDRWLNSFANFLADVGRRPSPKHMLDRIDVNGDYEPNNVRWATRLVSANNTRRKRLEHFTDDDLRAEILRRKSEARS